MSQAELQLEVEPRLTPETAMAARVIRSIHAPRHLLMWLSAPAKHEASEPASCDLELSAIIEQLVGPLVEFATSRERKQARNAAAYLSMICREITMISSAHGMESGPQLVALGLLPLYRCLATGEFGLCFEQARHRLLESLAVLALCVEFGDDLIELLENSLARTRSPHVVFEEQLNFNVVSTGILIRRHVFNFDEADDDFIEQVYPTLRQLDGEQLTNQGQQIPDWADPNLLWRMAGEITTDKPNLVLPRSWIEVAVPWQSAIEHWRRLADVLAGAGRSHSENEEEAMNDSVSNEPDSHDHLNLAKTDMNTPSSSQFTKALIAEILSHNDPAFVNLIQRQLGRCRVETRSISLAAVVVKHETRTHAAGGARKNTIQPWHHKIVSKIAEHPDIDDSFAFVTSDSQLFVCMLDIERSDATRLLRNGMTRILGIEQADDVHKPLSTAKPPGSFYAGLATSGNANPSLTAEDFIEATLRCLTAAVFGRKSSIKSIEVY